MSQVRAPSNIALIKYMGKADTEINLPANASLSLTLQNLCTWVQADVRADLTAPQWTAQLPDGVSDASVPDLDARGVQRILSFIQKLRERLPAEFSRIGCTMRKELGFDFRSANTFPSAAGIASSASSFAAMTLACAVEFCDQPDLFRREWNSAKSDLRGRLAKLAREGSGSACRSMMGPWVEWRGTDVHLVESKMPPLSDLVIIVGAGKKSVSSSEAHRRVRNSPLWAGRVERVEQRLVAIKSAILVGDVARVSKIAWDEFQDMHELFRTSAESFSYDLPGTREVLDWLRPFLDSSEPPIVTMDAGPNVHVLVSSASEAVWREKIKARFAFDVLVDRQGGGAEIL